MIANAPFTAFYSKALRDILPCLSGQELKILLAIASFAGGDGQAYPGVRILADLTTYRPPVVSDLLKDLQEKGLIVCLRKDGRDPITKVMLPDVYAVSPEIVMVSDPSLWHEFRLRNAYMPESLLTDEFAQPDRITEAESVKQNQRSRITAPEGAAPLPAAQTDVATRNGRRNNTTGKDDGADSTAGSQRQPNSPAQPGTPPGSAAPPRWRELSFTETVAVNAIRRQVPDMGHEKASELVIKFGMDQFTAAVMSFKKRSEKVTIRKPTGWIIRNLEQGARK